jgi:signal transduction histidine kinase
MLSLRARMRLGAILWTVGLVIVSFTLLSLIFRHMPDMPFLGRNGDIHFVWNHTWLALAVSLVFMFAGVFQVRRGLSGITQLRGRLGAVHEGRERRVDGRFVPEVQPLVDDLNALLNQQDEAVRRAVAKAGDLAHGLKTPLAILAREAERAHAAGETELGAAIDQQVERMRRQIDYHLAHARAAASGATPGALCVVRECVDGLARTLFKLHADRQLTIEVRVPPAHAVRVQREDLDEMVGNLLDNACKWTRGTVVVDSVLRDGSVAITVDDDGAGLPAEMRTAVLRRGVRTDEKTPGFGLGLAIVRDLAEVYRGSISLDGSPLGGLRATLTLPAA